MLVLPLATEPSSSTPAPHFSSEATTTALLDSSATSGRLSATLLTLSGGARSAWHSSHPLGLTLLCTAGGGLVQQRGHPALAISSGDVIWAPPDVDHWHGASPHSALTLLTITPAGTTTHWKEPVTAHTTLPHAPASQPALHVLRFTPSTAASSAPHFTGRVAISPQQLHAPAPAHTVVRAVTFECCSRTDWHSHPLGQLLLITEGSGLMQERGQRAVRVVAGDVVWIPPLVEHWHGASQQCRMTHTGVVWSQDGRVVDWLEPVSDAEYNAEPT